MSRASILKDDGSSISIGSRSSYQLSFSSASTVKPHSNAPRNSLPLVEYEGFLRNLGLHEIKYIQGESIERLNDQSLGSGATVTVYRGVWRKTPQDREIVALKYCNHIAPQEARSIQGYVRDMNQRFKCFLEELKVTAGKDGRYHQNFPRLLGMSWEEIMSPAGMPMYCPIFITEAAISDLEQYVRQGGLDHRERYKDEKRFISSLLSAMNFLHQDCTLVHGDLKPSNVLVFWNEQTELLETKLADFGLAYDITGYGRDVSGKRENAGVADYWSPPEAYDDDMFNLGLSIWLYTRDYYSFGLVVWFILFGYPVGSLQKGLTQEDEDVFKNIKQEGKAKLGKSFAAKRDYVMQEKPRPLKELMDEQFKARWQWKVLDPSVLEELKSAREVEGENSDDEDLEKCVVRGNLLSQLIKDEWVTEQEWDPNSFTWFDSNEYLHHTYRALMETALERHDHARKTVLHKSPEELFTSGITYQIAALDVIGDADPKKEVFESWALKHGPTSLRRFEQQLTQAWGREKDKREREEQTLKPALRPEVVAAIPRGLATTLLNQLVLDASDISRSTSERHSAAEGILSFEKTLPGAVDYNSWLKQRSNLTSPSEKIAYVIYQKIEGRSMEQAEAERWILEGITTVSTRESPDMSSSLRAVFKDIDGSLMSVPLQSALWDYATEAGFHSRPSPTYEGLKPPGLFQAILDGDFQRFKACVTIEHVPLTARLFSDCNLLNFAILHRNVEVMRYLVLEKGFILGQGEGFNTALNSLIFDADASNMLIEMDTCYSLTFRQQLTYEQIQDLQINPLDRLFEPELLALIAEAGSRSFMDVVNSKHSDPKSSIVHITSLEEAEEEWNPLFSALQTRRLPTFVQLLSWGHSRRPTFSRDERVKGETLLVHAIQSMAPFFVAALLANGASVNLLSPLGAGGEKSALFEACCYRPALYQKSLRRRYELHQEMGFPENLLKEDRLALESAVEDSKAHQKLIVELLLKHGADINVGIICAPEPETGERAVVTPLMGCLQAENPEMANFLISKGAEINPADPTETPLLHATNSDHPSVVECLLSHGASPNGIVPVVLGPPILFAAIHNRMEIFTLLLSHGADLSLVSPLCADEVVFFAILEQTSLSALQSIPPVMLPQVLEIAEASSLEELLSKRTRLRRILVAHLKTMSVLALRSLMNTPTRAGATAIFCAADHVDGAHENDLELLQLIITNTRDIAARLPAGFTAIERAVVRGNQVFVGVCLEHVMRNLQVQ